MISFRPSPSVPTAATSRCFHTDADGRIALRRDWPAIFSALQGIEEIAVQSRHTYARLIHLGPPPEITWDATGLHGRDQSGALQLRAERWGEAWGRLRVCACCASPGHIQIQNARGGEILELCATDGLAPAAWAGCLAKLVAEQPARGEPAKLSAFPQLPGGLQEILEDAGVLPALFEALRAAQASTRFLLRTPEVLHLREFIPRRVTADYPLLVATDFRTTLQLALPPVQRLVLGPDLSLHLAGPGETLLLSLAPGTGAERAWRTALCEHLTLRA